MILSKDRLSEFISVLLEGRKVIAPTIIDDDLQFREILDPDEVILDFTQTTESVKKYFLPQTEILFTLSTDEKGVTIHPPSGATDYRILFGVRPCDLHAVHQMPLVYRSYDPLLQERIDKTVFICLNCNTVCSDSSFCSSMSTGPFYHGNKSDIDMIDLGDCFLIEDRTETGRSLLREAEYLFNNNTDEPRQTKIKIEQDAIAGQRITFDVTHAEYLMSEDNPIWEEKAEDCFRCGGCNYICPTCVCYDVVDSGGVRERSWDSCLMSGFTILASGDNPRGKLSQRIAQRYLHKFVYTKIQSDVYSCVGCGRCTDICLFNDNMGETVANLIIKGSDGSDAHIQGLDRFADIYASRQEASMIPFTGTIVGKIPLTEKDAMFTIALPEPMKHVSGQFVEIGIFGIGEVPVSIASPQDPTGGNTIELVIRDVGKVTHAFHQRAIGSTVGIRGPYGTGWPMKDAIGMHVFVIAGGIGLCPLRGTILELLRIKPDLKSVNLYYGAREPSLVVFKEELAGWRKDIYLHLTVDSISEQERWTDDVGLITDYFKRDKEQSDISDKRDKEELNISNRHDKEQSDISDKHGNEEHIISNKHSIEQLDISDKHGNEEHIISNKQSIEKFNIAADEALAFVCGPSIMIKNVCRDLEELGFKDKNIHVSLERMMKCGIGTCGHCNMGEIHVCRDGPVFSLRQLKDIHGTDYPF